MARPNRPCGCVKNPTIDGTRCVTRLGQAIKPVANEELLCSNVPVIQSDRRFHY